MNPEFFKVEIKRGIEALLPYARKHKHVSRSAIRPPSKEHQYEFPPYVLILTVESPLGADHLMISVSAPMRPVKTLDAGEKASLQEAVGEVFQDHDVIAIKSILPGNTASKIVALPPGVPPELREVYRVLKATK